MQLINQSIALMGVFIYAAIMHVWLSPYCITASQILNQIIWFKSGMSSCANLVRCLQSYALTEEQFSLE